MKTAATLFILFSSLQLASAQVPQELQERPVLDSFHRSIDELNSRFGIKLTPAGFHADAIQALKKISQHVEVLEFVIGSQKQIPKEYLDGIGLDAELLQRLARQEAESELGRNRLSEGLKEVESDLDIKANVVRGGAELVRLVQVLVHARKGDQELGAYEVWYVPKGWLSEPSVFKRFDRLTDPSNPSSMNLAPGNYFIWLSKGSFLTDRTPASVGVNGEVKREIDLVVP